MKYIKNTFWILFYIYILFGFTLTACDTKYEKYSCILMDVETQNSINSTDSTRFCYEVVVELTDRYDNGATIDIKGTRQNYTIFIHNENLRGAFVPDVTNNIELVGGNFKYLKNNLGKGKIVAQWANIASYIKKYKIKSIKKKYY